MSLDKLRALHAAATTRLPDTKEGFHRLADYPAAARYSEIADDLLLPAMETLDTCATKIEHTASSHASEQWAEAAQARAVLAKLEEALK